MKCNQLLTPDLIEEVRKRYTSIGWGETYIRFPGENLVCLTFRWTKDSDFVLPDISDLRLPAPELQ